MALKAKVVAALAGLLGQAPDVVRCAAARTLGVLGSDAAVEALVAALLDEDEDVRTDAAGALARLGDASADKQLLENLLGDPCSDVKAAAIRALARSQNSDVVPWLCRLVAGRDEEIVWDEEAFFDQDWDDWVDLQVAAIEALAELGSEDGVPEIVAALDDEYAQDIAETAFKALARLGEAGVVALSIYADGGDERLRRRAAAVMATAPGEVAEAAVERALSDPEPGVRLAVAEALAAKAAADPRLKALLGDADPQLRAVAAAGWGEHHPAGLRPLFEDRSAAVRTAAFDALAAAPTGHESVGLADLLRRNLAATPDSVPAAAAYALAALSGQAALGDLAALLADEARGSEVRLGALRGLSRLALPAVPALSEAMADDERQIRLEAMTALAGIAAAESWPNAAGDALLAALRGEMVAVPEPQTEPEPEPEQEPEPEPEPDESAFPESTLAAILGADSAALEAHGEVRGGAELGPDDLEFLGLARDAQRAGGKKRVPLVPQVAAHEDVPRFAANVLGDIGREEVALALTASLQAADGETRIEAARSLCRVGEAMGKLPETTQQDLAELSQDRVRDLKLAAVRGLGLAEAALAEPLLRAALADQDGFVRREAVRALARLGPVDDAVDALLSDTEPGVRGAAAEAIFASGRDDAVALLMDFAFAFGGAQRREAGRLLRRLDAPAANARLLAVLEDESREPVWQVAIETLEEINAPGAPGAAG